MSIDEVKIEELERPVQDLNEQEADDVKGGLPAVQKVRDAAARMSISTSASSTTSFDLATEISGDGSV